jgi:hypothetical protein
MGVRYESRMESRYDRKSVDANDIFGKPSLEVSRGHGRQNHEWRGSWQWRPSRCFSGCGSSDRHSSYVLPNHPLPALRH